MPRTGKKKRVQKIPKNCCFISQGADKEYGIVMKVEEYECIRLIDYMSCTQEECAGQMGVSRATVQMLYAEARKKLARFLVEGIRLQIEGGDYIIGHPDAHGEAGHTLDAHGPVSYNLDIQGEAGHTPDTHGLVSHNPSSHGTISHVSAGMKAAIDARKAGCQQKDQGMSKERKIMRIAVTYENGQVFQHFGHTEQFKVYDVEEGKVVKSEIVDTNGQGHGALAGFLFHGNVDVLICGGIGGGARNALAEAGIRLFPGAQGDADAQVESYLAGTLNYDPDTMCNHHEHQHGDCGGHEHGGCGHHCG